MKSFYQTNFRDVLKVIALFLSVCAAPLSGICASYTWTGAVSSEWSNPLNWSPSTGYPDYGDDVVIVSGLNVPDFEEISALNNFTITSGSVNLQGFTIVIAGAANFEGGTLTNGNVYCSGSATSFGGTEFLSGVGLTVTSANVYFNGGTFYGAVTINKSGPGENISNGGNIFKSTFTLTNSGSGNVQLAAVLPDVYEGNVTLTASGTGLILASHGAAGTEYKGNITFNSTGSSQGIRFGQNGGTSELASGKTLNIGGSGFSIGDLRIKNFTQLGATAQSLALSGSAALYIESGNTFNGGVTFTAPQVYLNGSTFQSASTISKTGSSTNQSLGGNTFNSTVTISNSGTGDMILGVSNPDTFSGVATFTCTGSGTIFVANTAAGTHFAQNIVVNSTGPSKGIRFGQNNGSATLASGRTISIGGSGFTAGSLRLRNFTQQGNTAQILNVVSGTSQLYLETGTTFNGNVNFSFPQLFLDGVTFEGNATLQKRGATDNSGKGGCTFNGTTSITNSGTGRLNLGTVNPDTFNGNLTLSSTGSSLIQIAHTAAGTVFNGDVKVNSTGASLGVKFGQAGGSSTLADTKTLSIGLLGFEAGELAISGLTQIGATPQSLTEFIETAVLILETGSVFNGEVTFSAPRIYLNGTTFNADAYLTKNAGEGDISEGGNIFNGDVYLTNSGWGELTLGNTNPDIFNGNLVIENISMDVINLAYASIGNQFNGNLVLNCTGQGVGIRIGQGGGTSTLASGGTLSIGASGYTSGDLRISYLTQAGSTAQTLYLSNGVELYLEDGNVFNGSVDFTSPGLFLNGSTFNSNAVLTKTGTGFNLCSGGNVFNGVTTISNTGSGSLILAGSFPDTYNDNVTFLQTNAFTLYPAYNTECSFAKNISTSTSNTAVVFASNGGRVLMNGTGIQRIDGDAGFAPEFVNLTVNKASGNVAMNVPVSITGNLTLTKGNIISSSINLLTIHDNATVSGTSNTSYVQGPVRKEGNDAFIFPVGKAGYYRPIGISAPSGTNHHFTAEFFMNNPHPQYPLDSKDASLDHLSQCEYWILNRTGGNSNVNVSLSWDDPSCGISNLGDLRVARWDGTAWRDHGNGGSSGNTSIGTVTSSGAITNFSPFTLGSSTEENPLPVNLVHFEARPTAKGDVLVKWATVSESNNEYFSVEVSADAVNFREIARVSGAGNSNSLLNYSAIDKSPLPDVSYYRLRQVDFDGKFSFSNIEVVNIPTLWLNQLVLSPNPADNFVDVRLDPKVFSSVLVELHDIQGKLVYSRENCTVDGQNPISVPLSEIHSGLYLLKVSQDGRSVSKRLIKK